MANVEVREEHSLRSECAVFRATQHGDLGRLKDAVGRVCTKIERVESMSMKHERWLYMIGGGLIVLSVLFSGVFGSILYSNFKAQPKAPTAGHSHAGIIP